jgi:hypothetical protein
MRQRVCPQLRCRVESVDEASSLGAIATTTGGLGYPRLPPGPERPANDIVVMERAVAVVEHPTHLCDHVRQPVDSLVHNDQMASLDAALPLREGHPSTPAPAPRSALRAERASQQPTPESNRTAGSALQLRHWPASSAAAHGCRTIGGDVVPAELATGQSRLQSLRQLLDGGRGRAAAAGPLGPARWRKWAGCRVTADRSSAKPTRGARPLPDH